MESLKVDLCESISTDLSLSIKGKHKEKDYVDKTSSNRNEIWLRSYNVCNEQVNTQGTKTDETSQVPVINFRKYLETLSDCV